MIQSEMKIKNIKLDKTEKAITQTKTEIKAAMLNNKKMETFKQHLQGMPDPIKFVEQKNETQELINAVKNKERKIEIAEVAAKKAKAIIRKNGGFINEEMPMDMQGDMGMEMDYN